MSAQSACAEFDGGPGNEALQEELRLKQEVEEAHALLAQVGTPAPWSGWDHPKEWRFILHELEAVLSGMLLDQPRSWTCGPTAVVGTLGRKEPQRLVQMVINLYTTGRLSPREGDGQAAPVDGMWSRDVDDGIAAQTFRGVDDLLVLALKNTGSALRRGYDGTQEEQLVNATFPSEVDRWSRAMLGWEAGRVVSTRYDHDKGLQAIDAWNAVAQDPDVVGTILVRADGPNSRNDPELQGLEGQEGRRARGQDGFVERMPDHWLQLRGPIEFQGEELRAPVIDHGMPRDMVQPTRAFTAILYSLVINGRTEEDLER